MFKRSLLLAASILIAVTFVHVDSWALTGQGVGVRVGWVFDYDQPVLDEAGIGPSDLSMYGAHITLLSISRLSIEAAFEYASQDYLKALTSDLSEIVDVEFEVRDYAVYLTGRYKLIQGNMGVHLGGGLNFHRMTYSLDGSVFGPFAGNFNAQLPDNGWHSGLHGLAGVSFGLPMLPFRAFGEARVAKISVEGEAGMQATFLGGVTFGAF